MYCTSLKKKKKSETRTFTNSHSLSPAVKDDSPGILSVCATDMLNLNLALTNPNHINNHRRWKYNFKIHKLRPIIYTQLSNPTFKRRLLWWHKYAFWFFLRRCSFNYCKNDLRKLEKHLKHTHFIHSIQGSMKYLFCTFSTHYKAP